MGKVSVNISPVRRSKRLNPLEYQENSPQGERDMPEIPVTPKKKVRAAKNLARGVLKCAYHQRRWIISEELANGKGKKVDRPKREATRRNRYHQAYMGCHHSPIEVLDDSSNSGDKTNYGYCQYLMAMIDLVDFEDEVVMATPLTIRTPSGHTYFVDNKEK